MIRVEELRKWNYVLRKDIGTGSMRIERIIEQL